ncbi:MAG: hypothetical protein DWQ07_06435 [Chloroflexi bacterium]|nr:MAG: hypothetical protein DWQ07_06435 [Chloroflexota bacterium]MBL1195933.1 hypothetical protein [Chloroflexota bacterium]NOH13226.1 hypothetical protein [Chloroflexota bacterium]
MERTVPRVASEEIELYLRTYYSLLRATAGVHIRTLVEAHAGMDSLLHHDAQARTPDMSALIYCLLRLPSVIPHVEEVVLGQSVAVFERNGMDNIESWQEVNAPARRRRCFYDGESTLACLIASRSDIDDIVPMLTALQIEWNKLHRLMQSLPAAVDLKKADNDERVQEEVAAALAMSLEDLQRLASIWGDDFTERLQDIARSTVKFRVRSLDASLSAYRKATHNWWDRIEAERPDMIERPLYFISSNTHSLVNMLTGFALQHQDELIDYVETSDDADLREEWAGIQEEQVPSSRENFLYYVLKKYCQTEQGRPLQEARADVEAQCKILRIPSKHSFDLEAQVFELAALDVEAIDPRLRPKDVGFLKESDALILNVDYPLGLAAYDILSEVSEHAGELLGVYILGKAATLNAVVGDVMIPTVVHDEQSRNSYMFGNCFDSDDVSPYLVYGTVLDNQKAVTVRGTFLQNSSYMDVFYREGYTSIEMEAGPYLSAAYEMYRPKRHPIDEIVNLYELPFDLGILHYASDKPLSKGKNLGAASLSYFGMDPTYATSIATLRRVFERERQRLKAGTKLPV